MQVILQNPSRFSKALSKTLYFRLPEAPEKRVAFTEYFDDYCKTVKNKGALAPDVLWARLECRDRLFRISTALRGLAEQFGTKWCQGPDIETAAQGWNAEVRLTRFLAEKLGARVTQLPGFNLIRVVPCAKSRQILHSGPGQ